MSSCPRAYSSTLILCLKSVLGRLVSSSAAVFLLHTVMRTKLETYLRTCKKVFCLLLRCAYANWKSIISVGAAWLRSATRTWQSIWTISVRKTKPSTKDSFCENNSGQDAVLLTQSQVPDELCLLSDKQSDSEISSTESCEPQNQLEHPAAWSKKSSGTVDKEATIDVKIPSILTEDNTLDHNLASDDNQEQDALRSEAIDVDLGFVDRTIESTSSRLEARGSGAHQSKGKDQNSSDEDGHTSNKVEDTNTDFVSENAEAEHATGKEESWLQSKPSQPGAAISQASASGNGQRLSWLQIIVRPGNAWDNRTCC